MTFSNTDSSLEPKDIPLSILLKVAVDLDIDARGLACPMPLLRAKQALNSLSAGAKLRVVATDGGSVRDFHSFALLSGHSLEAFSKQEGEFYYVILKKQ